MPTILRPNEPKMLRYKSIGIAFASLTTLNSSTWLIIIMKLLVFVCVLETTRFISSPTWNMVLSRFCIHNRLYAKYHPVNSVSRMLKRMVNVQIDHLTGTYFEFRLEFLVNITCKFPIKVILCEQSIHFEWAFICMLEHFGLEPFRSFVNL